MVLGVVIVRQPKQGLLRDRRIRRVLRDERNPGVGTVEVLGGAVEAADGETASAPRMSQVGGAMVLPGLLQSP